jgi:hypothetical protein
MGEWSDCSLPCGGGSQTRNFIVSSPAAHGGTCAADGTTGSQACNTDACPPPGGDDVFCMDTTGDGLVATEDLLILLALFDGTCERVGDGARCP